MAHAFRVSLRRDCLHNRRLLVLLRLFDNVLGSIKVVLWLLLLLNRGSSHRAARGGIVYVLLVDARTVCPLLRGCKAASLLRLINKLMLRSSLACRHGLTDTLGA